MDNPIYRKPEHLQLWIHLLFKANYKDNFVIYRDEKLKIKRGQFVTSRDKLSQETGIQESKIERILKYFETEQQIEQQNLHAFRLITVLNYNEHQRSEQLHEHEMNSERTASEQPVNTTNKENKDNKENKKKENKNSLSREFEDIDKQLVQLLIDLMQENDPNSSIIRDLTEKRQQTWLNACRLLREKNKRSPELIEKVIRFSQADNFWKGNILSMPKLREQFNQLFLKAKDTKFGGIEEWASDEKMGN